MSAELMRRAAAALRDAAGPVESGPWVAEIRPMGGVWINLPAYKHAWGMGGFPDEARYVERMHPPVALALADWLDSWALVDGFPDEFEPAYALARAILREES